MKDGRQLVGKKKLKKCEQILGGKVIAAFVNGNLPHNMALAFVTNVDAYLVNLKTKTSVQYMWDGEILLKKLVTVKAKLKDDVNAKDTWEMMT